MLQQITWDKDQTFALIMLWQAVVPMTNNVWALPQTIVRINTEWIIDSSVMAKMLRQQLDLDLLS